jgi:hypothetical protein
MQSPHDSSCQSVELNLTRAERLRQSILQQAFSGRLLSPRGNDSILNFSEDTVTTIIL